jgi:hypothetical protein
LADQCPFVMSDVVLMRLSFSRTETHMRGTYK